MRNLVAGFAAGTLLLVLGVLGYLRLGLADVRADVPPSWAVTRLFSEGVHASIRRTTPKLHNPVPVSDASLIEGGKLFLNDCVGCHGAPGQPPSEFGATFYPPAPQFALVGTAYSETEVFWVAKHGVRRTGMSAQGPSYSEEHLWMLASFISRMRNLPPSVANGIEQKPSN
ncbi:MAG TPA: cytochrome c [Terriglobales bacterium]|jgi:mono/diheme cytochrome c family protein|nr:cytochrome c [Terriglobales bacterium]